MKKNNMKLIVARILCILQLNKFDPSRTIVNPRKGCIGSCVRNVNGFIMNGSKMLVIVIVSSLTRADDGETKENGIYIINVKSKATPDFFQMSFI